jgi:glycosyltransferase involved in cell wall biosynthesis
MTVLESWSNGRPVIAHRIGALPELVREGVDGLLTDPDQPGDLAQKIDAMFSDPKNARAMGLAGREHLETYFNRNRWLGQIRKVYEDLGATLPA